MHAGHKRARQAEIEELQDGYLIDESGEKQNYLRDGGTRWTKEKNAEGRGGVSLSVSYHRRTSVGSLRNAQCHCVS